MRIICLNYRTLVNIDTHRRVRWHRGSLVQTHLFLRETREYLWCGRNNIIFKASWYEGMKTKLLGDIGDKVLVSKMSITTLIWFVRPNSLELFLVVCYWRQSWPGKTSPGGIQFWRKKFYFDFRFYLIKGLVLQSTLRCKRPQFHLLNNQVKLSPNILWVDGMMMGPTLNLYILIRWDENISFVIYGVYGKTDLAWYTLGR